MNWLTSRYKRRKLGIKELGIAELKYKWGYKKKSFNMNNISVLLGTMTNGYWAEILDLISITSIFCGILVVISKNPIRSVLFLIGLFVSIAGYLVLLGLDFIGIAYLLVYVGAVSILFLFILMLINVRISELLSDTSNSIFLAILIAILFYSNVDLIYLSGIHLFNLITLTTSQSWDGYLVVSSHITSIGNIMYTSYSIWLIITSIILLLAMVGAIVITIKWESNTRSDSIGSMILKLPKLFRILTRVLFNSTLEGAIIFFSNLSLKKLIYIIKGNIIFRSFLFLIGMVLVLLGMSFSQVKVLFMLGIFTYYVYILFIKNKYKWHELPKPIINIIFTIIFVIMPFWLVVGLLDPITMFESVISFLCPTINMNPSGGEGSNDGGHYNNNNNSGNTGGNKPPQKDNFWSTVLGVSSSSKDKDQGKSSLPSGEDKEGSLSTPKSLEDKALMDEAAKSYNGMIACAQCMATNQESFQNYLGGYNFNYELYKKAQVKIAEKGYMPKPAVPIMVKFLDKSTNPPVEKIVPLRELGFPLYSREDTTFILGNDLHNYKKNPDVNAICHPDKFPKIIPKSKK
jgi:NADH-ubiquinone oxidoreductase chain 6